MRRHGLSAMAVVAAVLAWPAAVRAKTAVVSISIGSTGLVAGHGIGHRIGHGVGHGVHPVIGHGGSHGLGHGIGRRIGSGIGHGLGVGHGLVPRGCGSSVVSGRIFSSVSRGGLFGSFFGLGRTTFIRSGHHGTTMVVSRSVVSPVIHRSCVTQVVTRPVVTEIVRQPVVTHVVTEPVVRQVVVEASVVSVWITNSNGSKTEVKLTRSGPGYIGPRGEYYTEMPNNEQLRMVYGF